MRLWAVVAALSLSTAVALVAQNPSPSVAADRVVPRPPAREQGAPETGSTVTDGYAPIPQWLGQTRASWPAKSEAVTVQTVVSGIGGGFSFHFLPDGRILIGERPGRMRIASKDGALSEPIGGLPELYAGGPQGLFEVLPDRDFAKNRTLYFGYTALPSGPKPAVLPRLAGLLMIARARLSSDDRRLEDVRVLLRIEPTHASVSHFGCRLLFDKQGKLFMTSGERMDPVLRVQGALSIAAQVGFPEWLEVNEKEMRGVFKSVPARSDVLPDINENLVVELYSK